MISALAIQTAFCGIIRGIGITKKITVAYSYIYADNLPMVHGADGDAEYPLCRGPNEKPAISVISHVSVSLALSRFSLEA